MQEIVEVEIDDLGALRCNDSAPPDWLLAILSLLLPAQEFNELLMTEYLVDLQLLDFILDLSLGGMHLPHVDTDRESVLLVHDDLRLHHQMTAQQDIEQVRARTNIVNDFIDSVLLLTEVGVHLLDNLWRPRFEKWDLTQIILALRLLHVLNMKDLVMKVSLLENKTDGDSVG